MDKNLLLTIAKLPIFWMRFKTYALIIEDLIIFSI